MASRPRRLAALIVVLPPLASAAITAAPRARDCADVFGFYGAVEGARFSPGLPGDLGRAALLGYLSDPVADATETVSWEIALEDGQGRMVRRYQGTATLQPGETVEVRADWDGSDEHGRPLPAAAYHARFRARARSGGAEVVSPFTDAHAVVLEDRLAPAEARRYRCDPAARADQGARQNAPHEPIPYAFWYGNPHAHSTRSDGGGSTARNDCAPSTLRADGAYPDDAYAIAKSVGDLDWLMVAEHNHMLDDADPYDTRAPHGDVSLAYAQGRTYADAATTPTFVAMYGQEWGELTNCGHVDVYDAPRLMSWESGRYDVYTPYCKFTGSGNLYDVASQPGNTSPATGLPHLVLCHPQDADMFYSYARDAYADAAVRGVAVVSGTADSCATNFPSGGSSLTGTYKDRFVQLLDAGWKLAPEGHQDNHGDNYGNHSEVRTVILAEKLTRACLLRAQYDRRVYATQDRDGQLIFTATASNGTRHFMGEAMGGQGGVALHASWWDPDADAITLYRILRGKVGGGCTSFSCLTTVKSGPAGTPTGPVVIDASEAQPSGSYYYLIEIQQPGKIDPFVRHTVSAPVFVDYDVADSGVVPPVCGQSDDVLAGEGLGLANPNRVRILTPVGGGTTVDFDAYAAGKWGVNVAAGDVDGGAPEIVSGPGPGAIFGPQVRAFTRAGAGIGKVNFYAYGTLKYGVNVAAGDLDGDGKAEIVSGAGPGVVFGPHVRGFNYDGAVVAAISKISFFAYATLKFGVNGAAGSIDPDGPAEMVTGPGPGAIFGPQVRAFDYDAFKLTAIAKVNFNAFTTLQYGCNVAAGDVDGDGNAEILAAPGPGAGASFPSRFVGFDYDGAAVASIPGFDTTPFSTSYGGRVGAADANGDTLADLLCGAGRDPAADATVKAFSYASGLQPLPSFLAFPTPATYGVNVAGGAFAY